VTRPSPRNFYDSIADRFETLDHPDDLRRRLAIVFDECLGRTSLAGKCILDAGCGYGAFSAAAAQRGAAVVSLDIGERLVGRAIVLAASRGVVADAGRLAFRDESFDIVISSEMIEHTEAPEQTVQELARVLRGGGLLVLTTPNQVWQWPFHGLENFIAWGRLERSCSAAGLEVLVHLGFHPWPFQLGLGRAARTVEKRGARGGAARLMVNQAVVARKRPPPDGRRA
jgi:2-polyprenyl-3-methyl-5-hydroxy-6-metoxy-1,4-benzoquinol methylase